MTTYTLAKQSKQQRLDETQSRIRDVTNTIVMLQLDIESQKKELQELKQLAEKLSAEV